MSIRRIIAEGAERFDHSIAYYAISRSATNHGIVYTIANCCVLFAVIYSLLAWFILRDYTEKFYEGCINRSARESDTAANAGMSEEWVRIYLESMGRDLPDSDKYFLSELVRIPLRLIDEENTDVSEENNYIEVPLIILYEDRSFHVICQKEYLSMLRMAKKNAHYAFIFARKEEYDYYLKNFGKQFQR